jgi:Co/Zn/Cd efflux system component
LVPIADPEAIAADILVASGPENHHDHRHKEMETPRKHRMEFGMMGVLLHVLGDVLNNMGVIIAGVIIWKTNLPGKYYADPAVSMAISIMIFLSSLPLVKRTGHILLQSPPVGLDVEDIKHDLEKVSVSNGDDECTLTYPRSPVSCQSMNYTCGDSISRNRLRLLMLSSSTIR